MKTAVPDDEVFPFLSNAGSVVVRHMAAREINIFHRRIVSPDNPERLLLCTFPIRRQVRHTIHTADCQPVG